MGKGKKKKGRRRREGRKKVLTQKRFRGGSIGTPMDPRYRKQKSLAMFEVSWGPDNDLGGEEEQHLSVTIRAQKDETEILGGQLKQRKGWKFISNSENRGFLLP